MRTVTLYEAFDGERFDSADACRAHEAAHVEMRLVGLTIEQVRAALSREDTDLADVIEELGTRINKARRAAGDLRRGKAQMGDHDAAKAEPAQDKMSEALRRAREAGLMAWEERKGATVPDAFAVAPPLAEAWLSGWREGQAAAGQARQSSAA